MKKIFASALIIALCFSASTLNAQNSIFTKGTSNLNAGLFVPTYFPKGMLPAFSVSYDYCVADFGQKVGSLGVGGYAGLAISKVHYGSYGSAIRGRETFFCIGPRAGYHFSGIPNVPKLDLYGVLFMGLRLYNLFENIRGENNEDLGLGLRIFPFFAADAKVGAKYWFTKSFCFYLEAGWGHISMLEGGVSFKF